MQVGNNPHDALLLLHEAGWAVGVEDRAAQLKGESLRVGACCEGVRAVKDEREVGGASPGRDEGQPTWEFRNRSSQSIGPAVEGGTDWELR